MKYIEPLLLEGKNIGKLYHILDYEKLLFVLKTNTLQSYKAGGGNISFTRNKSMNGYLGDNPTSFIKLEIDGNKLSNNYKIRPYSYTNAFGEHFEEYEEQVRSNKIDNIFNYVDKVIIIKGRLDFLLKSKIWREEDPSDYVTTIGTRYGNIRDMIKNIKNKLQRYDKELYVQEHSVIKIDNDYINHLEIHPIKEVKMKFIICYRGNIPINPRDKYRVEDVLLDFDGKIIQMPCIVGLEINDIDMFNIIEVETMEDAKKYIGKLPEKTFSQYGDKIFKPFFIKIRLLDNGDWKLDNLTPLFWLSNYNSPSIISSYAA